MLSDYKRVLCPIQFDPNSIAALAVAKEIAKRNNGKLFVLHVVSPHTDPIRVGGAAMAAHDEKVSEQELAKLEQEHLQDIEHEALLRLGHPAEEVAKAEHEFGIDLVVMATHGRTGVSHLVLGSVAERVVRESACPVLTIRAK
ncbi:MAG: universal stress protein [Candidatus Binataceae bacterium]